MLAALPMRIQARAVGCFITEKERSRPGLLVRLQHHSNARVEGLLRALTAHLRCKQLLVTSLIETAD